MNKKLKWCFKLKEGLRIVEPNERLAKAYLRESKSSLERAEKDFKDDDLLWATVIIYYADYYALYSFLQKIGVKCENHSCSIEVVKTMLGKEQVKTIEKHKDKRIDAQYYMKIDKQKEVAQMLQECKTFVAEFDQIVENLSEKDIKNFRKDLKED
ncbi:MAG: HEPN domain-containing protein [archaeon]